MLEGEIEVGLSEGRLLATELPDDVTIRAGDFVDGAGMSGRDQVVSIGVLVNRIDVAEYPSKLGILRTEESCLQVIPRSVFGQSIP